MAIATMKYLFCPIIKRQIKPPEPRRRCSDCWKPIQIISGRVPSPNIKISPMRMCRPRSQLIRAPPNIARLICFCVELRSTQQKRKHYNLNTTKNIFWKDWKDRGKFHRNSWLIETQQFVRLCLFWYLGESLRQCLVRIGPCVTLMAPGTYPRNIPNYKL